MKGVSEPSKSPFTARNQLSFFSKYAINRFTRSVWFDWRDEFQPIGLTLPKNALHHHMRAKLQAALQSAVYQGDIWTLPERLWLIENEVEGW